MEGLSAVICCYNGAQRLPATLAHLLSQESPMTPWELLVIDNGSTDDSAAVAKACWQQGPAPMRIIHEPRLGVGNARERGVAEAKYALVGFIDDDNWVSSDWIRVARDAMLADSSLGAVGSVRIPAFEVSPPAWFAQVHPLYAVFTDRDHEEAHEPLEYLPTAGLCLRKAAWDQLVRYGFRRELTGSVGGISQGGEDVELTRALRLSGWKLRIERRLRLRHFIPSQRLQWTYLRMLQRSYGSSDVLLDAYSAYSVALQPGFRRWLSDGWWYQLVKSLATMGRQPRAVASCLLSSGEGQGDVLEVERQFGRALGLVCNRQQYGRLRRKVRDAVWLDGPKHRRAHFESRPDKRMAATPE